MSKARARSGEMRDWDKGMSSSGEGSSSSHLVNQSVSSSLIISDKKGPNFSRKIYRLFPENYKLEKSDFFTVQLEESDFNEDEIIKIGS